MKRFFLIFGLMYWFFLTSGFASDLPFGGMEREKYLAQALEILNASRVDHLYQLQRAVNDLEHKICHSLFPSALVNCMKKEAQLLCAQPEKIRIWQTEKCLILTDLLIVNHLNDSPFLSKEERFKATLHSRDVSVSLQNALERKYSLLTTQMLLKSKETCKEADTSCTAALVDRFCRENSNLKNLAWQACTGAIIWFIGKNSK